MGNQKSWVLNSRRGAGLCSLTLSLIPANLTVNDLSLHLEADLPGLRDFQGDTVQSSLIPAFLAVGAVGTRQAGAKRKPSFCNLKALAESQTV